MHSGSIGLPRHAGNGSPAAGQITTLTMKPRSLYPALSIGLALALVLAAFVLRLDHLVARFFHVDEYISMLAARMTAVKGVPILPSGMLYNQGLLLSYLAAPFSWLSDTLSEEMLRWPSLLAGLLTVAGFYGVGRRILSSRPAGLYALAFAAFDGSMIVWSGRMRMYALAGLFMLGAVYFIARGILMTPRPAYRFAAVACFLGAILSHAVAVVAIPAWLAAAVVVMVLGRHQPGSPKDGDQPRPREWLALAIALLVIAGLGFSVITQVAVLRPDQPDGGAGVMGLLTTFFDPGISWQRIDDYAYYFTTRAYWPLTALGGVALLAALAATLRGRATRHDLATLLLGLIFLFTLAELSLVLVSTWRKTRYLFVLCQPVFILLAADGLARIGQWLTCLLPRRSPGSATVTLLLSVALIVAGWGVPALSSSGTRSTGDYDTAFKWVKSQWQAGDRVMTVHPSAAYLYLGHSDYYAAETSARVLMDDDSDELVDRYVGSTLIDSVEALNAALAREAGRGRVWFVVDQDRLFRRYTPLFTQQVFAQMDIVHNQGGVPVFLSHAYPKPAPVSPPVVTDANFGNLIALRGYALDFAAPMPDGTLPLTLYWRPLTAQIPRPFKVFVQLRNSEDAIVAQADHHMLQGMLSPATLASLIEQNEWLRDTTVLAMPSGLPAGEYRLLVGLYDPDTFERVPLTADASGENAVLLTTLRIP